MNAVAAVLVLLALNGAFAAPEPCTFSTSDGCRCHTDTMTVDISEYFVYPTIIRGPEFAYLYSPCSPITCRPGDPPAVLCREGAESHALGRLDNSTTWYVESPYPLQFTIHYYNGDPRPQSGNREAVVSMLHDNSAMAAVFINEDPELTYNFAITGDKVVPQQETCMFDPTDSCRCRTHNVSLDISKYFEYPVEIKGQDDYNYIYSPCTPIPCGNELVAVCQELPSLGVYHPVGKADSSTIWNVSSYNPLQFTIHYFGGDENRNAVFNMSHENTAMSTKFISEFPLLTYNFGITGNEVVSKPDPGICTFYPFESCRCHTDNISLDISDYFEYPMEVKGEDVYSYIYSPCAPIRCGNETSVVCQVWPSTEVRHVAGILDGSTIWYVTSYDPLQFTIRYFGGEEGRNTEFSVSYADTAMSLDFISEKPLLTYHFSITGNKVVPEAAANVVPHASNGSPLLQSSTEEEEEERPEEGDLFSLCVRACSNKLILLGALALLFLILLLTVLAQRRRVSSTGSGYYAIPSKQKDILF